MKKVLILGVNGFIGHHLSKRILETTDWEVYGMDMSTDRISDLLSNIRACTSSKATSRSTRNGSSTTSRSAT
jgi:nucleoside-diphosphate-sugar epimerase